MSYIGNKQQIALFDSYTKAEADAKFPDKTSATPQDFAAMPTVAGDPIVESGSNADGEWTRWADGTQVTKSTVEVDTTSNGNQIVGTHPVPFLGSQDISGSWSPATTSGISVAQRDSFKNAFCSIRSSGYLFACDGTGEDAATPVTFFAFGYWK